jgi:hypothetical protein
LTSPPDPVSSSYGDRAKQIPTQIATAPLSPTLGRLAGLKSLALWNHQKRGCRFVCNDLLKPTE